MTTDNFVIEDYRDYLRSKYLAIKQSQGVTYETVSEKLGVSKVFISNVLKKKKHLSLERLGECIDPFQIPPQEVEYFLFLGIHCLTRGETVRAHIASLIGLIKTENNPDTMWKRTLPSRLNSKFETSLLPKVVVCMADFEGFTDDPDWLQSFSRVQVSDPKEWKEAFQTAVDEGWLKKEEGPGGIKYRPIPYQVISPVEVSAAKRASGYESQLQHAMEFLKNPVHFRPAGLNFMTISIDESRASELREILEEASAKVRQLEETSTIRNCAMSVCSLFYSLAGEKKPIQ